ncbi:MAG: Hypothetical protein AJITA_01209 [Acetilactobacillus jinshanensis]
MASTNDGLRSVIHVHSIIYLLDYQFNRDRLRSRLTGLPLIIS